MKVTKRRQKVGYIILAVLIILTGLLLLDKWQIIGQPAHTIKIIERPTPILKPAIMTPKEDHK